MNMKGNEKSEEGREEKQRKSESEKKGTESCVSEKDRDEGMRVVKEGRGIGTARMKSDGHLQLKNEARLGRTSNLDTVLTKINRRKDPIGPPKIVHGLNDLQVDGAVLTTTLAKREREQTEGQTMVAGENDVSMKDGASPADVKRNARKEAHRQEDGEGIGIVEVVMVTMSGRWIVGVVSETGIHLRYLLLP